MNSVEQNLCLAAPSIRICPGSCNFMHNNPHMWTANAVCGKNHRLTASETATLAKLSRIAGLSWSMMSIIGLSSSCGGGDKVSQSKSQNRRHQPPKPSICSHLRLLDGHEEAAYLPQDGDGQPARAQLAGAEQHQRQPLHGVQDGGVRAALGRYLESRAGLQQLRRARTKEKNKASVSAC